MLCRQENRKQYISKYLNIAEKEDKLGWFREQYDFEEYKRIIKNPMYFARMRENIGLYLTNVKLMKDHFNLIFTNAFNYNKPKDKAYKDAERLQEIMNKLIERKWDKLIEKQDMTLEEIDHQKWVHKQIEADPDFLDKSEDIIVPSRNFKYIPQKVTKAENQEISELVEEKNKMKFSEVSVDQQSDNDSASISGKLRKRRPNLKYTEDEHATYPVDAKMSTGKQSVDEKSTTKKVTQISKDKKDPEIEFSSDEDSDEMELTAVNLLKNPEKLDGYDVKQYYYNPVR